MGKYLCADYLRLSKEDLKKLKMDESMSIESQRMIIESFCKFNDLELIKEYVDDGYTGSDFDRPAFKEMLKDIESGKINCVITKDFSRLGRELYQTGTYIEDYFMDKNVRYIAINDGYDSLVGDSTIPMKLTFNDYTLRDTSKKIKSAFKARQMNGYYIGSFAKYGLKKDPKDPHHLIIDPIASVVVKRIFDMALQGNKCNKIASTLTSEKIPIPIVYKKEGRGLDVTENDGYGIWRPQTIKDILTSEMYIGNMVQNICNKIRYNSKKNRATKREDHIIVENTHDAIIDKEKFDEVQKLFTGKKKIVTNNSYLFGGLLFCKECGHSISILKKKNKKNESHYTQCCLYSKKGKYGLCNSHRINYDWLENDLLKILSEVCQGFIKEYDNKLLLEEANNIINEDLNRVNSIMNMLNKDILKYENAIKQLYLDKVDGKINEEIFNSLIEKYNEDLKNAKKSKSDVEKEKNVLLSKTQTLDYESCAKKVTEFLSTKKITQGIIKGLISKIEIDNDKKIKIYFTFPELSVYTR